MPNNRKSIVFRMVFLGALGVNMAKCVSYGIENNVKNCNFFNFCFWRWGWRLARAIVGERCVSACFGAENEPPKGSVANVTKPLTAFAESQSFYIFAIQQN